MGFASRMESGRRLSESKAKRASGFRANARKIDGASPPMRERAQSRSASGDRVPATRWRARSLP